MSETIRVLHGRTATSRHPGRRTEYVVAGLVLLAMLGSGAFWVANSQPALPDRLQVLSTTPVTGSPGEIAIVARLTRADGGRIVSFSSGAQLTNRNTGKPLLQHQSGFASSDRSQRYLDLVLQGTLHPQAADVPAIVTVEVRAIPISEQLHWTAHNISGNLIPAPPGYSRAAPVLSCAVRIPTSASAVR